jgi:hypothetical protein
MLLHTVMVAHATLDAIDNSIKADGGAAFRVWLGRVIPHMGDAYRGEDGGHRSHMGASIIGGECARSIWYSFRWAHKANFEPRMLRLFNRGHLEEARFIALLLAIGCEVWQQDANGNQFRITHAAGHFGGSGDGVGRGIPDLPVTTPAVLEFKTHGEKSFIKLAGKLDEWRAHRAKIGPFTGEGVRAAKFEHFVQMQVYMRKMALPAALYMAVNKNTDDVYAEVIHLDSDFADQFLNRGETLIYMQDPPKRISESPGFWKCRLCDKRAICHMNAEPDLNCRTCTHSRPVEGQDGQWRCVRFDFTIDKDTQRKGCEAYERNPAI